LRSLSLSLSALAVAFGSLNVPVKAQPLSSFLLDLNLPENQASFSPLLSQAPETIPEVIVDTIPIDSPSSSSSGEDVVVESPSTPTS
ncbi:hypothetical protein, partial [Tritonibacter sp. SIMBA_163]|uniref:hypothetical protein n=1 Tax=Tritonibacter sp. SIMBA_163 TaxID=3080868 RepID=UPI00397EF254